jgi:hypothetical protein
LQKAEVEYIATHGGGYPETFQWDLPGLAEQLRRIGFKIRGFEYGDVDWIVTTSGVYVSPSDGFIYKNRQAR